MSIDPALIAPAPRENEPCNAFFESAETLALLARRRSTKVAHFAEPGPSPAQLDALIRLAARAPDHGKLAPWRFVIMAGEARVRAGEAIAAVISSDAGVDETQLGFARALFLRAPAVVMVVSRAAPHPKIPEWEQQLSSGAACYGLLIAAHAMGFAGCWLTEWPAYDARARAALGLAEHERVSGFVYLGAAREPALERARPAPLVTRF
jgi:nitroreductase